MSVYLCTMLDLLESAVQAALATAPILRSYHEEGVSVNLKEDQSPVTQADLAADQKIRSFLERTGIPILSEEAKAATADVRATWDRFWVVDPLDGTKEFIAGRDEYTINIALIEGDVPVMSVISFPAQNLVYMAHPELGPMRAPEAALRDEIEFERWKLPPRRSKPPFTVATSRSHLRPETEAFIDQLKQEHDTVKIVQAGSSYKFCLLAEGKADVYPRYAPCMLWDTAAGEALIRAAGLDLRQMSSGKPLDYRGEKLVNPPFIAGDLNEIHLS